VSNWQWVLVVGLLVSASQKDLPKSTEVVQPSAHYVSVDGLQISYEEYGHGRPIVFLHGFGACSYSWRAVAKELASDNRCISVDLMGFGLSDKPRDEEYTLDRQASLLRKVIDQLSLERPVLVGNSYGGGVCLSLIHHSPDLGISGSVLV
jgi:pimeloyl-ACP methyl ester carboxylesterase